MRRNSSGLPLFDERSGPPFETKIRTFAREVAKRHRGRPADPGALILALRGYYRMWSIFERLPALNDRAIGIALAEYEFVRSGRRANAA